MVRYISFAALCVAAMPATAGELSPLQAESVAIGGFHGIVFYTSDHNAFHVIATIAEGEQGLPVRFETNLADAQKFSISVPGKLGEQSLVIEILRAAGKLMVASVQNTAEQTVVAGTVGAVPHKASVQKPTSQ